MGSVKWIKITTDIFDDEKIKIIESRKDADSILVIWFKLLTLAGKQNNSGIFTLNGKPITDNMFAALFGRPVKKIQTAFDVFESLGMIEKSNDTVSVPKWDVYQETDILDKIREQNKERVTRHRAKQKEALQVTECNVTETLQKRDVNVNVTHRDKEEDKDIKKESKESVTCNATPAPDGHEKKAYGPWKNVMLTDAELKVLQDQYTNWQDLIDNFSEKLKAKGYTYANHCAAICSWEKKDRAEAKIAKSGMMTHGSDYYAEMGEKIASMTG